MRFVYLPEMRYYMNVLAIAEKLSLDLLVKGSIDLKVQSNVIGRLL